MTTREQGSNSVAIVALIVVGVLVAGGGALYLSGAIGGGSVKSGDTVIIEKSKPEEKSGITLKYEDDDGTKGEIETP